MSKGEVGVSVYVPENTELCAPAVSELHGPVADEGPHTQASHRGEASHLLTLPGGTWALWRWVGLRGAGFPIAQVLGLAPQRLAAVADRIVHAEHATAQVRDAALATVRGHLDVVQPDQRPPLLDALQEIKRNKLRRALEMPLLAADVAALHEADLMVRSAWAEFEQDWTIEMAALSQRVADASRDNRLREAITWQNRHVVPTVLDPLARAADGSAAHLRRKEQRQKEHVLVKYLQRYCAKNETIGFFGPMGWARLDSTGPAIAAQPGADLLAARHVYFEHWCIAALAASLGQDEGLKPWLAPRRIPFAYIDDVTLSLPFAPRITLPREQAVVLQACDGVRTARELAGDLLRAYPLLFSDEAAIFAILKRLEKTRRIAWTLEVPFDGLHPEQTLRRALERVEDHHQRARSLDALQALESARGDVASAADDAPALDRALARLDTIFTDLTGAAPTRLNGQTYAGRTLVHEDSRRDIDVTVGPEVIEALNAPLSLLLTSARWLTTTLASYYRKTFGDVYTQLRRKSATDDVSAAEFWLTTQALFFGSEPADAVIPVFQERWAGILEIPAGERRVAFKSADLRARVEDAFYTGKRGWDAARYHSPDLMIAAPSVRSIRDGGYYFVMGEFHFGLNTLDNAAFIDQHACPGAIQQALDADRPAVSIIPDYSGDWLGPSTRTRSSYISPRDRCLVFSHDASSAPPAQALPIGSLVMREIDGQLAVCLRDGSQQFDILDVFAELLPYPTGNRFDIVRASTYTPRIAIDRLVVARETWRLPATQLPFAFDTNDASRFVAARRWKQALGAPRFIFVKAPVEPKPFFVDMDNPILVDIFAKAVRQTAESDGAAALITVTEMLPTPDQIWLTDAQGARYTSELRIVAVDVGW